MDEKAPFLHVRETYSGLRNCAFLHFESKNANSFGLDIISIPICSGKNPCTTLTVSCKLQARSWLQCNKNWLIDDICIWK